MKTRIYSSASIAENRSYAFVLFLLLGCYIRFLKLSARSFTSSTHSNSSKLSDSGKKSIPTLRREGFRDEVKKIGPVAHPDSNRESRASRLYVGKVSGMK